MKLENLKPLCEVAYPGNIGAMEMFKFYSIATVDQKKEMQELIRKKLFDKAWEFLQRVTGTKLHKT